MSSLSAVFLGQLPADARELEDVPELEARLHAKWLSSEEHHPALKVTAGEFAQALGERRSARAFVLAEVFAGDLRIAIAALNGDAAALSMLEAEYLQPLGKQLGRGKAPHDVVDDTVAKTREGLLLGRPGKLPKLAQYTGQVPLRAWLRVVLERALLSALRKRPAELALGDTAFEHLTAAGASPELQAMGEQHRAAFQAALHLVVRELSAADRQLLHWMIRERLSIDEIAPQLGVHRATAARMCNRLRQQLFDAVRTEIRGHLTLSAGTLDSLCAQMAPDMDLTLSRLL